MAGFQELIELIRDGEAVRAATPNRPLRQLDGNVRYLKDLLETALLGQANFIREATVDAGVLAGQPVFFNSNTLQYELAIGTVDVDPTTGFLKTSLRSSVAGVIYRKLNSTKADILVMGFAEVDLSSAIDGTITPGIYYLSNAESGKLTKVLQPSGVPVLQVLQEGDTAGTWQVLVKQQFHDFLSDHRHYTYEMVAAPAGDHAPPAIGVAHTILNPDNTKEGWLPISDAAFSGITPPNGAKFGYNLSITPLAAIWPPVPLSSAAVSFRKSSILDDVKALNLDTTLDHGNIPSNSVVDLDVAMPGVGIHDIPVVGPDQTLPDDIVFNAWVETPGYVTVRLSNVTSGAVNPGPIIWHIKVLKDVSDFSVRLVGAETIMDDHVVIDENGIWWMTDCYNEVPWATNLNTSYEESVSVSLDPNACPKPVEPNRLFLNWTQSQFATDQTAVLSLRGREGSGIVFYCRGTDDEKSTGHLEADFDLSLLLDKSNEAGHIVFKTLSGSKFNRGPVVESIKSGSPEIALESNVTIGTDGKAYGNVVVKANLDITNSEFPVDTVRLNGTEEEFYEETLAIGFPSTRASDFRGRCLIPGQIALPTGTKLRLRFWILGRATGTVPSGVFTLNYRVVSQPSGLLVPVALPLTDTAGTIDAGVALTADQYYMAESDDIDIVAGDEVLFTLGRAAPDAYGGELHILKMRGIPVAT